MKALTEKSSCVALQVSCSGRLPLRHKGTSPEGDGSHCQESGRSAWGHKGAFEVMFEARRRPRKTKPVCHASGSRIDWASEPALQRLARVNIPRSGKDKARVAQLCPQVHL